MGRTASWWLLALGLLGSLSAHAASPVWAVRGTHNVVYLAGSIHMLPANDAEQPTQRRAAWQRAVLHHPGHGLYGIELAEVQLHDEPH